MVPTWRQRIGGYSQVLKCRLAIERIQGDHEHGLGNSPLGFPLLVIVRPFFPTFFPGGQSATKSNCTGLHGNGMQAGWSLQPRWQRDHDLLHAAAQHGDSPPSIMEAMDCQESGQELQNNCWERLGESGERCLKGKSFCSRHGREPGLAVKSTGAIPPDLRRAALKPCGRFPRRVSLRRGCPAVSASMR